MYPSLLCSICGCRKSPLESVRQLKAFWGIFSTSIKLFSMWTEAKVVPELRGWHTPHLFTILKGNTKYLPSNCTDFHNCKQTFNCKTGCAHLISLLSSLSTFRFLNCLTQRGTSLRWLLSNRSSSRERYVPTKEWRSTPWLRKALWDRRRDARPGRRWRNVKAGMWVMLLCWRSSLRSGRGRLVGAEVNRLKERSKDSSELNDRNTKSSLKGGCALRKFSWPSYKGH